MACETGILCFLTVASIPAAAAITVPQNAAKVCDQAIGIMLMAAAAEPLILGIIFVLVFARLISWYRITSPREDLGPAFSVARYREVEGLLREGGELHRSAHPGCRWRSTLKLRDVRIGIIREYMRELFDDFNHVCRAARCRVTTSQVDRSDVAGPMMKEHFVFALALMSMEIKLLLYRFGWRRVELSALMRSLETMRIRLQFFAEAAQPASAARVLE